MAEDHQLDSVLVALLPHVPDSNGDVPIMLREIPKPCRPVASMRTLLDNLARVISMHPACGSVSLAISGAELCVSATSSDPARLRSQLSEWIQLFNKLVEGESRPTVAGDVLGLSIYSAIFAEWAVLARTSGNWLVTDIQRFVAKQSPPGHPGVSGWAIELESRLSSVLKYLPEDQSNLGNMKDYQTLYAAVETLWNASSAYSKEQERILVTEISVYARRLLKDLTVAFETIRALTDNHTADHFPQGLQLCWVGLPAPRRFEAKVTEDHMALLDAHLEQRIDWPRAIKKMRRYMTPASQKAYNYSLGLQSSSGECYVAENAVPHCETVLVQYLLDKDVDYIACAPPPCWPCQAYTQVVLAVHNRPITLGNGKPKAKVELPWVCPPSISPKFRRALHDYFLWVIGQAVGMVYVEEEEEEMEELEHEMDPEAEERMKQYTVRVIEDTSEERDDTSDREEDAYDEQEDFSDATDDTSE